MYKKNGEHSQTGCYWAERYVNNALFCLLCHSYVAAIARRKQVLACIRNIV